jgi:hypothetical protein
MLGFGLIFADISLVLINVIGAVVFALLVPYVAIGLTLLYLDLETTRSQVPARRWREWLRRRPAARAAGIESGT